MRRLFPTAIEGRSVGWLETLDLLDGGTGNDTAAFGWMAAMATISCNPPTAWPGTICHRQVTRPSYGRGLPRNRPLQTRRPA